MNTENNISQHQLEIIERYLNNDLTPQELMDFEKKLQTDLLFKNQVEDVKQTILGIETAELKTRMDKYHSQMEQDETITTVRSIRTKVIQFAIAASIILALGLFYFLNQSSPSEKLFAEHFTPDPGLPTTMSTVNNYDFSEAMVNYKRKDYKTAISKWEKLAITKPENDTLNYFLGVAHLAEGNSEESLLYLQKLNEFPNSIFSEDAIYYSALALIKNGNVDEAIRLLKKNPSEKNNQLLKELK